MFTTPLTKTHGWRKSCSAASLSASDCPSVSLIPTLSTGPSGSNLSFDTDATEPNDEPTHSKKLEHFSDPAKSENALVQLYPPEMLKSVRSLWDQHFRRAGPLKKALRNKRIRLFPEAN
jgi:hypothetical protein